MSEGRASRWIAAFVSCWASVSAAIPTRRPRRRQHDSAVRELLLRDARHTSPGVRAGRSDGGVYPARCGWCGGRVLDREGWTLHGYGMCRVLQDIGDPPCLVTVTEDVLEWLT